MAAKGEWALADGDVTRLDDLVLRPARPWTATVHTLLGPPARRRDRRRPRTGRDPRRGRGAAVDPRATAVRTRGGTRRSEAAVRSAGALLRRVHDATEGFEPPEGAEWAFAPTPGATVVTHGDPGPWNFVWRDGEAVALVDWDHAAPAPAMDDVAYAVDTFAPFRPDEELGPRHGFDAPARPGGAGPRVRRGVRPGRHRRHRRPRRRPAGQTLARITELAERGHEPWASWVRAGYLDELRGRVRWTREHRHLVE